MRVILRDGRVADLREASGSEEEKRMLREVFAHASPTDIYYRFFHAVRKIDDAKLADMLCSARPDKYALLCVSDNSLLGISHYTRTNGDTAEVDFFVDERYHGNGVGRMLLDAMAESAWRAGLRLFEAYVLQENQRMINLMLRSGYEVQHHYAPEDYGTLRLVMPLGETERSRALRASREQLATAASLRPFLHPKTVAVVGASRDPSRLGHLVLRHVLESGYNGTAYPVNPSAHSVGGVLAYPGIADVPEHIDLALLIVPAMQIPGVVEECIEARVGAVAILSSGLGEAGDASAEGELGQRLREAGIRVLGPSCFGLLTTSHEAPLNASFAPRLPHRGRLAIASQSGALGVAILDYARRIGVGVSSFVSMGNKIDVSSNDLLQYWENDPETDFIGLYLESFGNPRKFSQIARRITPHKPILVVKSARTSEGASVSRYRALQPHERAFEGLFRQTGVIRADTLEELFDTAALLQAGPLPEGNRVAVITNSAGGAVITVDALPKEGLELVRPPIDLGFEALAEGYRKALPEVLRDEAVDAVIVLFIPVGMSQSDEIAGEIVAAVTEVTSVEGARRKPIVANFLLTQEDTPPLSWIRAGTQRIPVYPFPERAVRALGQVARYAQYHGQPRGRIPDLAGARPQQAREIVRGLIEEQTVLIAEDKAQAVLGAMGLQSGGAEPADRLGLQAALGQDPLFGIVMEIEALGSAKGAGLVRIVPLTDRDAEELAEACGASLELPQDVGRRAIADFLLRLSRLAEEVPEVWSLSLAFDVVGDVLRYGGVSLRIAAVE